MLYSLSLEIQVSEDKYTSGSFDFRLASTELANVYF